MELSILVHGTWIDGKQILALTPHTLKEGVSIKLGASSRTYKVQWLHHPLPASSNKRSITPGTVDSDVSNMEIVLPVLECATKSNEACTESNEGGPLLPARPIKPNDSYSDNRKSGSVGHPLSCSKHEAAPPHIMQKIALAGGSVSGVETFNANISLQISQQQQQKEGLPPLPPVSRRMPFAPLSQNVASPRFKAKLPTNTQKKPDMEHTNKLKGERSENGLSKSNLWLRRCNSAPSPMLNSPSSGLQPLAIYPKLPSQAPSVHYVNTIKQENATPLSRASLTIKSKKTMHSLQTSPTIKALNKASEQRIQKTIDKENSPEKVHKVDPQDEERHRRLDQEECAYQVCSSPKQSSLNEADVEEDYPSDKENQEPACYMGKQSKVGKMSTSSGTLDMSRKPLQPLILRPNCVSRSASPCVSSIDARDDRFMERTHSGPSSVVQNLDYMLQKLKGQGRTEPRHEWHMVVDTTCLTDPKSFKSLKLLEGIRELRLIIPQIVIRELDFSKQKGKGRMSSDTVLKWIEACMLKHPSWIHVQNSLENLPVAAATPPDSPQVLYSAPPSCAGAITDLMSPTNGDRVLSCALLFRSSVFDGQVALLTNDTALKIKAMAEGIACEGATDFCDSLLSPYSERFLWAGSTAHGLHWSEKAASFNICTPRTSNRAAECNKRGTLMSAARGMASKKYQVVENLKQHCKQAEGLKGILS